MPRNIQSHSISRELPTIAIVGRPNVGKSSLFNAIIGKRLSIVHEQSGVTRDRVLSPVNVGDYRIQLIDTGGLGMGKGEKKGLGMWEARIAEQVHAAIEGAHVLIFVANTQEGIVPLDEEVASTLRDCNLPVIFCANKCDNGKLTEDAVEFTRLGFGHVHPVSCLHNLGIQEVLKSAFSKLPKELLNKENQVSANPFRIAVAGRPNVGKSSLVNALLGEDRVIVSPVAGTTRDAIDIDFEIDRDGAKFPALLIDTAGIRRRGKVDSLVEYFSTMRAQRAVERADLVLFIVEANPDGVTEQDKKIAAMLESSGRACIIVANKSDLHPAEMKRAISDEMRHNLYNMDYAPIVFISATEQRNFSELLDQIITVSEQTVLRIPTSAVNRLLEQVTTNYTAPVVANTPVKFYYGSMVATNPPKFLLFVNEPKYCAPNYLAFLKNKFREAFDFSGLPMEIELRARPKSITPFHDRGTEYKGTPSRTAPKSISTARRGKSVILKSAKKPRKRH